MQRKVKPIQLIDGLVVLWLIVLSLFVGVYEVFDGGWAKAAAALLPASWLGWRVLSRRDNRRCPRCGTLED